MLKTTVSGLVVTAVAVIVMLLGERLDLDIEATTLLGVVLGAVVALVPDRSIGVRLGAFVAGVVIGVIGYVCRAALLPDTVEGRTIAIATVLLLCTGVAAISVNHLPLWATFLGAAGFAGTYEAAYAAAPPLLADTAVTALTTLALTAAAGFASALFFAPQDPSRRTRLDQADTSTDSFGLHQMMEKTK